MWMYSNHPRSTRPGIHDDDLIALVDKYLLLREQLPAESTKKYRSLVGALQNAAVKFRPDVCFVVNYLSSCLTIATEELYQRAFRVLVYLRRTSKLGIYFSKFEPRASMLCAYADSNWFVPRFVPQLGIVFIWLMGSFPSVRSVNIA